MMWYWFLLMIGYILIAELVACLGAFGIAVGNPDRWGRAKTKASKLPYCPPGQKEYLYRSERWALIWITVGVALLWPIGVPIYLAVAQGHMVAESLKAREQA